MALKKLLILVLIISNFVCLYIATDKSVYNEIINQENGVLNHTPTIIMLGTFITNLIVLTLVDFRKSLH